MIYKLIFKCLYPKFWSYYTAIIIITVVLSALFGIVFALTGLVPIKTIDNDIFYEMVISIVSAIIYLSLLLLLRFTLPKE